MTRTVAVIGAGKMGLPLAAQYANRGWRVIAVDIDPKVVRSINAGQSHLDDEPGVAEAIAAAHRSGMIRATEDASLAAELADVIVFIVPVMLDREGLPDRTSMDAAVTAVSPGIQPGTLVLFETTLPVGDTRSRYVPLLERGTGLRCEETLLVAFSPERLYSGSALANLAVYPKLVGGVGPRSTEAASGFYRSVLDVEIVEMSSPEAAEFAKLADTTYRDVNIALANELAGYAHAVGVDITEVVAAANSQPFSHIHDPGLGVGGHCIPVYPRFLLADSRFPAESLVAKARMVNDVQVDLAVDRLEDRLGRLVGLTVLVLGLTYRHGVKETAYSRATPLVEELMSSGVRVMAYDPLLSEEEVVDLFHAEPWSWAAHDSEVVAIVTQTADPTFNQLKSEWFPGLRLILDGRNSLRGVEFSPKVAYLGIGVPDLITQLEVVPHG